MRFSAGNNPLANTVDWFGSCSHVAGQTGADSVGRGLYIGTRESGVNGDEPVG